MAMKTIRLLSLLAVGLLLTGENTVSAFISPHVLHESRTHIPHGWTLHRRHDPRSTIPLRFALAQNNIHDIEKHLLDVSHPRSSNYGKHWSAGKVARTFAPRGETIDTVRGWLIENGLERERIRVTKAKTWIEINVTVEEAERLLKTEFNVFVHDTGKERTGCHAYHLPSHIAKHVDFVTPTVHFDTRVFPRRNTDRSRSASTLPQLGWSKSLKTTGKTNNVITQLDSCDQSITPDCIRALYGFYYEPVATDRNSIGIAEYTPQAYLQSDLNLFALNFSTGLYGVAPYLVSIDGGYPQTEYQNESMNGESDLDLEYSMTLVTPAQQVTLYQTGDMVEGGSFDNFLDAIDGSYCTFEGGDEPPRDGVYPDPAPGGYNGTEDCGTVTPTYVISTSYDYDEADLTPFYSERQCTEYAKLGLMGITILYSSGDAGVAGSYDLCLTPSGNQAAEGRYFNPMFPSSCPYITAVGATQINPGSTVHDPESACEQTIYSGGGFSNRFALPEWQKAAVDHYLTTYPPNYPPEIWNSTGVSRAYPDISANGANYVVAIDGTFMQVFGTSCGTPVSASIFAMINDARLAVGKSPVGFINPTIYSPEFMGLFNDITSGTNPGCGTQGFNATPGWDPVTGLGTPNFPKLLTAWLALP